MPEEHHFQETKDDEPNVRPEHLGEPESLKDVAKDVIKGLVHFGEGDPPEGAEDTGHIESPPGSP